MTSNPNQCKRCGQPHPRCNGHNQAGQPCMMYPRTGAPVCKRHGGHAPQVKAAAERRRDEALAAAAVATYGLPREVAPDVALLEEVHRTAGHVAWLGDLVQLADAQALTQRGEQGVVIESVWVDMYRKERAHLVNVSKAALAAGIAERQVKVAEQQGALLAGVIGRVLDALELTPRQRDLVGVVVPRELRGITGGTE